MLLDPVGVLPASQSATTLTCSLDEKLGYFVIPPIDSQQRDEVFLLSITIATARNLVQVCFVLCICNFFP